MIGGKESKKVEKTGWRVKMSDSFMQNHQSALDSFMEDKAIQDLEDAGIYPVPDNDAILENLFEDALEVVTRNNKYQFPPCTD